MEKKREYNDIDDKRIFWDLLKFDIQTRTINISKQKSREKKLVKKSPFLPQLLGVVARFVGSC